MVIKLVKLLVLAAALILSPVTQVTADHENVPYKVPHDVATWLTEHDVLISPSNLAEKEGCDTVLTWRARSRDDKYFGYIIIATGDNPRLVAVEMWERETNERVLNWIDRADYGALKECHFSGESN